MKEEKRNYYFSRILECLLEQETTTIEEISGKVKISEKTTRNRITDLNDYLQSENLGKILKKPRIGIKLECNEQQKKHLKELIFNNENLSSMQSSDERLYDVLKYIFKHRSRKIITTTKIADSLYLSAPTILKILKDCESWLSQYNIKLENSRSKGIIIFFNENGYRRAVQKLILHGQGLKNIDRNIMELLPGVRTDLVRKAILDTEDEWHFEFIDESFYEILVYCCVAVSRGNKGTIKIDKHDVKVLRQYNEFEFAKSIFGHLSQIYNIDFNENEIYLLAIQIIGAKFLENNKTASYELAVHEYDDKINSFTIELISMVSNILGVDLNDDKILKDNLTLHLQSTIFRMKYGNLASNSLIFYIKKEYKTVFRSTWSLSILFEQYFGFKITEDELGFICIYIISALERKGNKFKILIVSNLARSTSMLLMQKIQMRLPSVDMMKVVSEHDFNIADCSDYNVILTTDKLDINDDRILVVNDVISEEWVSDLMNMLAKQRVNPVAGITCFDPICQRLFNPELILMHFDAEDKTEVLEALSLRLIQGGYVTRGFTKSVLEREAVTTTEIGNGIALPHGDQYCVNEPKVAIAVLDKPILWDKEEVDLVFLLAVRMISKEDVIQAQKFYKEYIALVDSEEKIRTIKSMDSNVELFKYLIK